MLYIDENYKDASKFQFPDRFIDPKEKEKEYCLKNAQAIYCTHLRNKSGMPIDLVPEWQNLRLYGKGLQNPDQYISQLTGGESATASTVLDVVAVDSSGYNTKEERRKAWANVNKQIISLAPKIKDYFYGLFKNQEYDVVANTIDEDSGALMENMKFRLLANSIFQKELALLRRQGGLPEPQQDFLPQDMTELELFESAGGFKLNIAMEIEKLLKHTFEISDWDNTIKNKLIDDATDIGYIAVREDIDEDTGKSKLEYVDVCNVAAQYSTKFDFEDSEWQGTMEFWNVSRLRQKGFSKEFLKEQIENYSGKFGNPVYDNTANLELGFSKSTFDSYRIPVFIAYWIDMDAEYQEVFEDSKGRLKVKLVKFGKRVDSERKEIRIKKERTLYSCKWIVGTDEVFDEGKAYNQTFKDEKPIMPIRIVKLTDNSIIRRLKPIFDDMQIAWLKYQNAQIMAMNAGHAINLRLLNNISMGSGKLSVKEVLSIFRTTGTLFYSDTQSFGKYEGGAVSPVTPLPGGIGEQLSESMTKFEWSIRMIENETGLTAMAMGATPQPSQGKATTELSMSATQNVIRPIIDGIMVLKGRVAENAVLRIQLLVNSSERAVKSYTRIIGRKGIEALKAAEGRSASYGVSLEPRPTEQQKQWVRELVNEAISLGRDGITSIELSDAFEIIRQLENGGNLKALGLKLNFKIKQYKASQIQNQMNSMKVQSEEVMKQNQQKQQADAQLQQMTAQVEMGKMKSEQGFNMQLANFEANKEFKLKLIEMSGLEKEIESREKIAQMNKSKV